MILVDLQNPLEFKMRQNSTVALNTKPEKISLKPLLWSSFPAEHRRLDSWGNDPLSPKREGKLLKPHGARGPRGTQSRGAAWQNPALSLSRGWRGEPGHPAASPGQGFSPAAAGPACPGCAGTRLYQPAPRRTRDQNPHSQRPWASSSAETALGSPAELCPPVGQFPWHPATSVPGPSPSRPCLPSAQQTPHRLAITCLLSLPAASTGKTQMECKSLSNPSGGLTHPHTRLWIKCNN